MLIRESINILCEAYDSHVVDAIGNAMMQFAKKVKAQDASATINTDAISDLTNVNRDGMPVTFVRTKDAHTWVVFDEDNQEAMLGMEFDDTSSEIWPIDLDTPERMARNMIHAYAKLMDEYHESIAGSAETTAPVAEPTVQPKAVSQPEASNTLAELFNKRFQPTAQALTQQGIDADVRAGTNTIELTIQIKGTPQDADRMLRQIANKYNLTKGVSKSSIVSGDGDDSQYHGDWGMASLTVTL